MFEQLPSKYFYQDGEYKVAYSVKIVDHYKKFSTNDLDWIEAIGCDFEGTIPPLDISEDGKVATWVDVLPTLSSKAIRYSDSELNFILRHTTL